MLMLAIVAILTAYAGAYAQDGYTVNKLQDLGNGFQAKHITHEDKRKAVLVKFPSTSLTNEETFSKGMVYSLEKVFGDKEFCTGCKLKYSYQPVDGIPVWYVGTINWNIFIKPLIESFDNPLIVGIEILPTKVSID